MGCSSLTLTQLGALDLVDIIFDQSFKYRLILISSTLFKIARVQDTKQSNERLSSFFNEDLHVRMAIS